MYDLFLKIIDIISSCIAFEAEVEGDWILDFPVVTLNVYVHPRTELVACTWVEGSYK